MAIIKVENIVASATISKNIELQKAVNALDGAEYDKERFPGVIYRVKDPKIAVLIFRSGKVVCTGARTMEDVKMVIDDVIKHLRKARMPAELNPKIKVENIVATCDVQSKINLNAIAMTLSLEKIEYEPEQFPGLVYRMENPSIVMLFFGSGRIVCTGAKNIEDVEKAIEYVTNELKMADILK